MPAAQLAWPVAIISVLTPVNLPSAPRIRRALWRIISRFVSSALQDLSPISAMDVKKVINQNPTNSKQLAFLTTVLINLSRIDKPSISRSTLSPLIILSLSGFHPLFSTSSVSCSIALCLLSSSTLLYDLPNFSMLSCHSPCATSLSSEIRAESTVCSDYWSPAPQLFQGLLHFC